jgi:hypothetical protein
MVYHGRKAVFLRRMIFFGYISIFLVWEFNITDVLWRSLRDRMNGHIEDGSKDRG